MSEAKKPICVEKILVSLDNSKHSLAALLAAVQLARHFDADLKGIFVEDTTLLSLAEMPFRQEVGEYTAIVREISTDGMTRSIFVQSRRVIRTFQKIINQSELTGDFSILRGKVSEAIQKASEECDLLILGKSGTNPLSQRRLGSTAIALVQNPQIPILLVEKENRIDKPIFVLFDDPALGRISLDTAKTFLDQGEILNVLLNAEDPEDMIKHQEFLQTWAKNNRVDIKANTFQQRTFHHLLQRIKGLKTGLFILPHNLRSPLNQIIEKCLEEVTLPILLIRSPEVC